MENNNKSTTSTAFFRYLFSSFLGIITKTKLSMALSFIAISIDCVVNTEKVMTLVPLCHGLERKTQATTNRGHVVFATERVKRGSTCCLYVQRCLQPHAMGMTYCTQLVAPVALLLYPTYFALTKLGNQNRHDHISPVELLQPKKDYQVVAIC